MAVSAVALESSRGGARRLLSALSGPVFVVVIVVAAMVLSGDTPGSSDSAAKINAFYDAHHARELAAALVVAVAAPLMLLFGTTLASALWPADERGRPLAHAFLVSGSGIAAAMWIVSAFIHLALTDAADQTGISGGALQGLNVLDADAWIVFSSGLGILMLGAAAALFARKAHRILRWIALVAGVTLFIPYADFPALLVSGLWIVAASIQLYRQGPAFASA